MQEYVTSTEKWLEAAVIGEIGNNTFDHNFQFAHDCPRGVYFNSSYMGEYTVVADFGMGVMSSLKRVRPNIASDVESVEMAFTQRISGRFPEQRGNGLKFVMQSVQQNNWSLFFQSGTGCCFADGSECFFSVSPLSVPGIIAVLHF